jgi:hypothetical protein
VGLRPGDPYYVMFPVSAPGGGTSNVDSGEPSVEVYHNGSLDSTFTNALAVTNPVTGLYLVSGANVPAYAGGDVFDVFTTVVVDSVTSQARIDHQIVDRLPTVPKNTALNGFPFYAVLASDHVTPATGKTNTFTCTRSIDGGAFASTANGSTETANGWYKINLAASDLNGNNIAFLFTVAGADPVPFVLQTTP